MNFVTWPNVIRMTALVLLLVLGVADYGYDALAKPLPREVYFGLIAVALGVDIKALREVVLRMLSGGSNGKK